MKKKLEKAYKSIGEVAQILDLKDPKTGKYNTHTIIFWEKSFKQVKPKFFNTNHRYYDFKNVEILKKIKTKPDKKYRRGMITPEMGTLLFISYYYILNYRI